jgi:hypothetical protein
MNPIQPGASPLTGQGQLPVALLAGGIEESARLLRCRTGAAACTAGCPPGRERPQGWSARGKPDGVTVTTQPRPSGERPERHSGSCATCWVLCRGLCRLITGCRVVTSASVTGASGGCTAAPLSSQRKQNGWTGRRSPPSSAARAAPDIKGTTIHCRSGSCIGHDPLTRHQYLYTWDKLADSWADPAYNSPIRPNLLDDLLAS